MCSPDSCHMVVTWSYPILSLIHMFLPCRHLSLLPVYSETVPSLLKMYNILLSRSQTQPTPARYTRWTKGPGTRLNVLVMKPETWYTLNPVGWGIYISLEPEYLGSILLGGSSFSVIYMDLLITSYMYMLWIR